MIVVQHKVTLEVKYLSVEEWMKPGTYQARQWKLLDIENTLHLYYKGKSVGVFDRHKAETFVIRDVNYTSSKTTWSDCFMLVNKNLYLRWQKLSHIFGVKQQINIL